jgi:DnaJ-domain-containing protein 1
MLDNDPRRMMVRLAVAMMAADGRVTPNEIASLERLEERGLGPLRMLVGSEIERAVRAPIDLHETCSILAAANPGAGAVAFAAVADIAAADGLDVSESRLLDQIAPLLGLTREVAAEILRATAQPVDAAPAAVMREAAPPASDAPPKPSATRLGDRAASSSARACEQLGVAPDATPAAIDEAYRRLVARYDPARVLDLGPEFAVLAVRRLTAATAAYELARAGAEGA